MTINIDYVLSHLPGIGPKTEAKLREMGFNKWDDFILNSENLPFNKDKKNIIIDVVLENKEMLKADNIAYFADKFPNKEHWRVLGRYFNDITIFDIETTGLSRYDNHATVICAFKNNKTYSYFVDENLNDFLNLVDDSKLLVSFNGNAFDIPFLEHTFHIPRFLCPHIDLRWVAYHAGYKNGLKMIEKQMGLERPDDLEHVDGYEAVRLYYDWTEGNMESKNKLIKYCMADTVYGYIVAANILNQLGFNINIDQKKIIGLL